MPVDIGYVNFPTSDALRDFTRRRVTQALRPFEEALSRAEVRLRDVNGPRGGVDIECSVMIELTSVDQPLVITSKGADVYAAIMGACARLHEAISRALGRRRRMERSGAPASGAGQRAIGAEAESSRAASDAGAGMGSELVVTTTDYGRLRGLVQASHGTRDRDAADALADELDRAEVVPAERIAGNVVTMNSRVVFQDEESGERRDVSLVYPNDSDPGQGRVSIFAPIGTALLGLSVGQTIDWPLPRGQLKRYRVVEVVYQPEAAGRAHP